MASITIVGLDPSLSNFGMCKGTLDLSSGNFKLTELRLQSSKPDNKNKTVRKNSQDLERSILLHDAMHEFTADADLVCVEIPVGSQTARAMASYGVCIGILASMKKPLIQVTPNEVKLAAVGKKTATKEQMIEWAINKYPTAPWLTRKFKGQITHVKSNEHLADATAAIHAGVKTDEFKRMLVLLN